MKKLFNFKTLPIFFQSTKLGTVALLLLLVSLLSAFFAVLVNWVFGLIWLIVVIIGLIYSGQALKEVSENAQEYLSGLGYRISRSEQEALIRMPIGIILLNDTEKIDWINPYMQGYIGKRDVLGLSLSDLDGNLAADVKNYSDAKETNTITWQDKQFSLYVQQNLRVIYMMDISEYAAIATEYDNHQLFSGLISVDNYEEVTEGMSESETSTLRTYVTGALSDWATTHHIYLRRLNTVHYVMFGYKTALQEAEKDKFSVLKAIREATAQQNSPVTLSMGVAYGEQDIIQLAKMAQTNLDLALGRGGDQVVVKSNQSAARFYGGATNPMEKRTRVRARMISQTVAELMEQSDNIMIVGHATPDLDAVGAGLGIWRMAQTKNKPAFVIIDEKTVYSDIKLLLAEIRKNTPDIVAPGSNINDSIVDETRALKLVRENTLLILIDHAQSAITSAPHLLDRLANRVVVIDHHRLAEQGLDQKPLLTYVEPYASSTSELVVEMLQYQDQSHAPITKLEATAMLGGIQIDTKNFTLRTGSRTFDAASYLRANGADSNLIQSFMKENLTDFKSRTHLINLAVVDSGNAIVTGESNQTYSGLITAQAADELLQISSVEASYVVTKRADGRVGISARSTGQRNVQRIMEAMGGGGHLSNAATQISGETPEAVTKQLKEVLQAAIEAQ
ncbi:MULTISPECIES: DHH family phosphoesterase [Leuconostoc]|uniref:Cyclic-di-AMP phosphodiesterase n=2 Tax=Leuconostoc citreum TaxID=33964 RepID=B1MWV3_LEUCK|nr:MULTISPECIES: DHH family phosphoesterase [Leuconostoc]ACA82005.1 Predicted signaling protein consisting of a modified GGDEF domain and a DHH domain [Leuconostoc citreum KM20]KAF0260440.1 DHH family phosphoesterase [Leuconostoc citreum]MBA5937614.1 DHH family phosphoesterase [Leuconostoc citreum]MBE4725743.1 DHH family phosphoesterase [Leuconostoc citreum]MCJ2167233.1 DHH family phosphoesterase [Leuconostoc citreum]